MATAAPLRQIDENFLQCTICLNQLKRPKLLPCGHHYCRDCLAETVKSRDTNIQCPTCRRTFKLPQNGVDGFTNDFNTNNIIEFVQSQGPTNAQGGKPSNSCPNHPNRPLELFCVSCDNQPMCVTCDFQAHKGHELENITALTENERKKLRNKIAHLVQHKEKLHKKREVKKKMMEKATKMFRQYDDLVKRFENVVATASSVLATGPGCTNVRIFSDMCAAIDPLIEEVRRECPGSETLSGIAAGPSSAISGGGVGSDITETSHQLSGMAVQPLSVADGRRVGGYLIDRSHQLSGIAVGPSSAAVGRGVGDDVTERSHQLCDMVAGPSSASSGRGVKVNITDRAESVVRTAEWGAGINSISGCENGCIVGTGASNKQAYITVITIEGQYVKRETMGTRPCCFENLYCDSLSTTTLVTAGAFIRERIYTSSELGIYNIRENTHRKLDMNSIALSSDTSVTCVAADSVTQLIYVGGRYSSVHVFNINLEYIHTLELPANIRWPTDMTIHSGNLVVCFGRSYETGISRGWSEKLGAFMVTSGQGSACRIVHELTKPTTGGTVGGDTPYPRCVCRDKNAFIYIIWESYWRPLVQYSQDGRQVLATISVNECKPDHITTVETDQGEKLVMAIGRAHGDRANKMITYRLAVH